MKVSLIVALALLMTATVATAQHQHDAPVTEISGKDHPEQIPDTMAYMNWLQANSVAALGVNPTLDEQEQHDNALRHQDWKLARLRLNADDDKKIRKELAVYRAKFEKFNKQYTAFAEKGWVKPNVFWAGMAQIISETRGNLEKNLSEDGHKNYEDGVALLRSHTRFFTTNGGVL